MSNGKKQYRIAVIPGDGIGKEVVPEGLRVLEQAAKKHGVAVHFDHFDFASWDYYEKHGEMMPEDWKAQDRQARRDLFRRGRLAGENPRSHFVVGIADQVSPGVRPVRQSAPGAADAGRAVAARRPQARRYRFLGGARKHRRRIFLRRRADVPGYRARIRHPADGDDPDRRRSHPEVRVRSGAVAAEEASDLGDQVQRHLDHHALLGRARGGDGEKISRGEVGQVSHRHSHREFRAASGLVRRRRRLQPVRRHPLRSRARLHRHHRHRAVGQHQSGRPFPLGVRAGAWLGARYRGAGHRQPDRHDLVRRDDAGASRREEAAAASIVGAIERTLGERTLRTRDLGGNADTTACGKAVAEMVE